MSVISTFLQKIRKISSYKHRRMLRIYEDKKLYDKYGNTDIIKLSTNDLRLINKLWGKHINRCKINYKWFELYHSLWPEQNAADFVPDSFYYAYVDNIINNHQKASILDDKNLYDLYFPGIMMPRTLFRIINGVYMNEHYQVIILDEVLDICKSQEQIVLKPSVYSVGGKGILFWSKNYDSMDALKEYLQNNNDIICQAIIIQHEELSKLHPNSVNSIRILTAFIDNEVEVVSSIIRIGVNKSNVDNTSSGGLSCGLNNKGELNNFAFDIKGRRYLVHPQGARFENSKVPNFDKCVELVKSLSPRFYGVSRLISWDLSINPDGEPILVEVNLSGGGINFHQMNNGPVLKKYINYFLNLTNNYYEN